MATMIVLPTPEQLKNRAKRAQFVPNGRPYVGLHDVVSFIDSSGKPRTGKAVRFCPGYVVCLVTQSADMVYPRPSYPKVPDNAFYGVPWHDIKSVAPKENASP